MVGQRLGQFELAQPAPATPPRPATDRASAPAPRQPHRLVRRRPARRPRAAPRRPAAPGSSAARAARPPAATASRRRPDRASPPPLRRATDRRSSPAAAAAARPRSRARTRPAPRAVARLLGSSTSPRASRSGSPPISPHQPGDERVRERALRGDREEREAALRHRSSSASVFAMAGGVPTSNHSP